MLPTILPDNDYHRVLDAWKGWSWNDCYLQAPDGTRFSPDMVRASLFAFELAHELTGSPLQVFSLRNELRKRIASLSSVQNLTPEVVIRWNGQETVVKLARAES